MAEAMPSQSFFLFWLQLQRRRIHAITHSRRSRTVRKYVAEMGLATGAPNLGPPHAVCAVGVLFYRALFHRFVKTRPPGARIELRLGTEQRLPAGRAGVRARIFRLVILAGKRSFS